MNIEDK